MPEVVIASVAVLDTRYPDLAIEEGVLAPHGVEVFRVDGAGPNSIARAARADVIITGSRAGFDANTIDALTVAGIVRAGIGVDNVDLTAASRAGVQVCNVPDYGTEAVAQHALAMALAGNRRLGEADRLVRRGEWGFEGLVPMHLPSVQTAGVVGFGRIGRRVAELFRAVGFGRVVYHDPYVEEAGYEQLELSELLAACHVVSLHVPGGDRPLLDGPALAQMRPGSVLVNTARGALIDSAALGDALVAGRPRVACLDVFESEPPDPSQFGPGADRLILSPHQAWYTEESQADLRRKSAEEALRLIRREPPRWPVNQPKEP